MAASCCVMQKKRSDWKYKGSLSYFLVLQCYRVTFLAVTDFQILPEMLMQEV